MDQDKDDDGKWQYEKHPQPEQRRTPSQQSLASIDHNVKNEIFDWSPPGLKTETYLRSPDARSSTSLIIEERERESQEKGVPSNMASHPLWTPSLVAKEYLQKEIDAHSKIEVRLIFDSKTMLSAASLSKFRTLLSFSMTHVMVTAIRDLEPQKQI